EREPVCRRGDRGERVLRAAVLQPFEQAAREDPDDANAPLHLANWYGQYWVLYGRDEKTGRAAVAWARRAQEINPDGRRGYETEYELRTRMAFVLNTWADNVLAWHD